MSVPASADMVKELRDRTGAGMMDCKAALQSSGGNIEQAIDYLRKKGMASAAKRAGREAKEGVILIHSQGNKAAILEANCETDFVARTDDFKNLAQMALDGVLASGEKAIEDEKVSLKLAELSGKIGEKMLIRRAKLMNTSAGVIYSYMHSTGRLGVLLEIETDKKDPSLDELGKNLCMQVAASNPLCLKRDQVPAASIEREKDIYREEIKGKPENIVEKIMQGKLDKFYASNCLLEQPFIKDDKVSVQKLVDEAAKKIGARVSIKQYVRFALGESIAS